MEGQEIEFTTKDGEKVRGTVDKDGNVVTADGTTYEGVYRNYDGSYTTEENWKDPSQVEDEVTEEPTTTTPTPTEITVGSKINAKGAKIYGWKGGKG
jgi:hypothetical protein